ncbi:uncharacterized protein LOC132608008 [Lycium barbarum]|uniref:uncharacterized protein LOC132608008 n=1 Tax=Lycium barbarum TaxID=112863 RepID=UPI00293F34A2|nr:uncharacterized protein LOC132608008 [Lycium barbarum]
MGSMVYHTQIWYQSGGRFPHISLQFLNPIEGFAVEMINFSIACGVFAQFNTIRIADSVEYVTDAVELWRELEDQYDQTNGAKLYEIQKEINDLSQGSLDITIYYTRMKKLWEELSYLTVKTHCSCQCNCGAKENMHKVEQDRGLIQFLMGLNEAFFILIQEEKQREFRPQNRMVLESASLHAKSYSNKSNNNHSGPSTSGTRNFRTNYAGNNYAGNSSGTRPFCDYCKRPGYTRDKCYKLHGYPNNNSHPSSSHRNNSHRNTNPTFQHQNYSQQHNNNQASRYNKGKRIAANVHGMSTDVLSHHREEPRDQEDVSLTMNHANHAPNITKEQYGQLMSLLQQF